MKKTILNSKIVKYSCYLLVGFFAFILPKIALADLLVPGRIGPDPDFISQLETKSMIDIVIALIITIIIEAIVYKIYVAKNEKRSFKKAFYFSIIVNLITVPIANAMFQNQSFVGSYWSFLSLELIIFLFESFLIKFLFRIRYFSASILSFVANFFTAMTGLIISWFIWPLFIVHSSGSIGIHEAYPGNLRFEFTEWFGMILFFGLPILGIILFLVTITINSNARNIVKKIILTIIGVLVAAGIVVSGIYWWKTRPVETKSTIHYETIQEKTRYGF